MASHPLIHFRPEILKKVILPKLEGLLYESKGDETTLSLWKAFRSKYDSTVSLREFKNWCSELQLKPKTQVVWSLPDKGIDPSTIERTQEAQDLINIADTNRLRGMLTPDDFMFDNEMKGDLQ
jgi:hypothetical protein